MQNDKRKAVFFDRDGVIFHPVRKEQRMRNQEEMSMVRAPFSVKEFEDAGGVVSTAEQVIRAVREAGFLAILVTNQPDVGYGHLSREEWERIHAYAVELPFDDIHVCFHGRDDGCECKKPKPGMLLAAAKKWNIELGQSFFIGDTESDTSAAYAAGCKSILIDAWYNKKIPSDYRVASLVEAYALIFPPARPS